MKPLFLALALLLAAHPALAQKEVLRFHWEPGKLYKLENSMKMAYTAPDGSEVRKTAMTQTFEVRVKAEPGTGNKLADLSITSIKASMEVEGLTLTYDSADPAKSLPFLQQVFGGMLNKGFTLVFDKDDKYVEARGVEKLTATPLGNTKTMDGKQLAEAFRKSLEVALPQDPVEAGDTWSKEDNMDMPPVSAVVKTKGKFDSIVNIEGRKHAKVLLEGTFGMPPGVMSPFAFGKGSKFAGETLFDLQRRVIVSNESTAEVVMLLQGQTLPAKQVATLRLLALEDAK